MRKLLSNLAVKIIAIILSVLTFAVTIVSVMSVIVMTDRGFYTDNKSALEDSLFSGYGNTAVCDIATLFYTGGDLDDYSKRSGIDCTVTDTVTDEEYYSSRSGDNYTYTYNGTGTFDNYADFSEETESTAKIESVDITVFFTENFEKSAKIRFEKTLMDTFYSMRYSIIVIGAIAALVTLALMIFLICAVGHRSDGTLSLNHLDKVPFDIIAVIYAIGTFLCVGAVAETYGYTEIAIMACIMGEVIYLLSLAFVLTFAARIKLGTLIKNTVIYRLIKVLWKCAKKVYGSLKYVFKNLSLVKKTVVICLAVIFVGFIGVSSLAYSIYGLQWFWILFSVAISAFAVYSVIIMQKIKIGGEKIASGDLEHKIDTQYMYGDFKDFSESLNNINLGLQAAINEKMRSERFKTELITNVSHDIKTPLTSIINYVDLIKKEYPDGENIGEYIEVLDRQSGRLKKLIEDLVEASKASTGNIAVNLSECEVGVLLSQTVGEFDDRLKKAGIQPILNLPETPVIIMADGRHLWRVFDNLMSNVCKYAQPGTRVYLDVANVGGKAVIVFKNISKFELNVSGDELLERFVRGDSSRNTEGSGLGLSIAQSLVALQNGSLNIVTDGDLFKVIMTFDIKN